MISKVVGTNPSISSTCAPTGSQLAPIVKNLAPGEARTPDLRISLSVLTYKYDALTDCATGAMLGRILPQAKFAETCCTTCKTCFNLILSKRHCFKPQKPSSSVMYGSFLKDGTRHPFFTFPPFLVSQNFHRPMRDLNPRPSD